MKPEVMSMLAGWVRVEIAIGTALLKMERLLHESSAYTIKCAVLDPLEQKLALKRDLEWYILKAHHSKFKEGQLA